MSSFLFKGNMPLLERSLQALTLRHSVISNNIANVETPGYKRSDVSFANILEETTSKALGVTHPKHIPIARINKTTVLVQENETDMKADGNNVDIDKEMALLAQNSLMFNAVAQLMTGEINKLRTVIREVR